MASWAKVRARYPRRIGSGGVVFAPRRRDGAGIPATGIRRLRRTARYDRFSRGALRTTTWSQGPVPAGFSCTYTPRISPGTSRAAPCSFQAALEATKNYEGLTGFRARHAGTGNRQEDITRRCAESKGKTAALGQGTAKQPRSDLRESSPELQ